MDLELYRTVPFQTRFKLQCGPDRKLLDSVYTNHRRNWLTNCFWRIKNLVLIQAERPVVTNGDGRLQAVENEETRNRAATLQQKSMITMHVAGSLFVEFIARLQDL